MEVTHCRSRLVYVSSERYADTLPDVTAAAAAAAAADNDDASSGGNCSQ